MILNQQKKVSLRVRPLGEFLNKVLRELNLTQAEVSVAFVSDVAMAKWNETFRHKAGSTDVLSFPAASMKRPGRHARKNPAVRKRPASDGRFLGDVAIAPATARRYARKNGRSVDSELRVLMLHGVLHLMGYDHESKTDFGRMERIERRLRRRLGLE